MEPHLDAMRYQPDRKDAEAMGFPSGAPYLGPPPYNGILPFQTTPAPAPETLRMLQTQYDACIRGFSRGFGGLIDELKRRGILENTIVVLVADHGEEFHEHGGWTHGHSLHGELTHVPLIVRLPDSLGPGAKASRGRTVGGVATLLDVFPTLTALCGVKYPRGDERPFGVSLVDELLPSAGRAPGEIPARRIFGELTMSPVGMRSIREGRWQLIVAHEPLHESVELYDDVSDPRHRHNQIDGHAVEAGELRATLDEWFRLFDKIKLDRAEIDLDADTRTRLKGLGYIGK
jgi:arylsulfatase A-like enzyme